jgi:hypothetical protein
MVVRASPRRFPMEIMALSALDDDNLANDPNTDADVINAFKVGSTIPHKVQLFDCSGR